VARHLARFEAHEQSLVAVARDPCPEAIRRAVLADPLVSAHLSDAVAAAFEELRAGGVGQRVE
jgi:hypothetical protein